MIKVRARKNEEVPLHLTAKRNTGWQRSVRQTDPDELLTKPVVEKRGGDPVNKRSDKGAVRTGVVAVKLTRTIMRVKA